jgi:uncharacterized protein
MNRSAAAMQIHKVGVISDTHGLLRMEAIRALQDCELILHAGDAGQPQVLEDLREIAPVIAVRGNVDRGEWAVGLPENAVVEVGNSTLYMLHDLNHLDIDPLTASFRVVISGHTHQPNLQKRGGVLYLNPGSAGPRRFHNPVSAAKLLIEGEHVEARILMLLEK